MPGSATEYRESDDGGAVASSAPWLLVVVPVINEESALPGCLQALGGHVVRTVVVDGGSSDSTCALALASGVELVHAVRGRANQMNAGAETLRQERALLFLHADVRLPEGWLATIKNALSGGARWGRFDVRLEGANRFFRVISAMMNLRSRLTGVCTGDQAIFVESSSWREIGGYARIALMEDIELSVRLRALAGWPVALKPCVRVSGRRWERSGIFKTILMMWSLRALYWAGVAPATLHRLYYRREP
ncbi:MAG: TIGR04283 family arsenosugar biosynthesis glycosyltransferase [Quisquiliibacterium sp.]